MKGAFTGANETARASSRLLMEARSSWTRSATELDHAGEALPCPSGRQVRPIGSTEESDVDRIIAATNKEFEKEIAEGRFREDLYYRLSVIPIQVPPLRERREDIPLLARHFLESFRKTMEKAHTRPSRQRP